MQNTTSPKTEYVPQPKKDLYQEVTNTIIKQLEAGTIPWHQPWTGSNDRLIGLPKNINTNKYYRGINILLLWGTAIQRQYTSTEWASFKQWQEKKEVINKGEKGTMIVYYDVMEKEVDGEIKKIPFLKSSIVFNKCQLASYVPEENVEARVTKHFTKIGHVEKFIENTRAVVGFTETGGACYVPAKDTIYMPALDRFIGNETCTDVEAYYSTLLHELTHWSGAPKRLNRQKGEKFGDTKYATEELVAELGAAFMCAEFGIGLAEKGDHANYIAGWLKALKDNKKCIFSAASDASKAIDYMKGLQPSL